MDDLVQKLPVYAKGSGTARYFWLHLLRPVNPLDLTSTKVVVDSMRFPYSESGGTVQNPGTTNESVTPTTDKAAPFKPLYSVGRRQPYRGGHAVPNSDTYSPPYPYGYDEQVVPSNSNKQVGVYLAATSAGNKPLPITSTIEHTLGQDNDGDDDVFDYFPFHDRDFMNVAELMLVPAVPPGLFTKHFVSLPKVPLNPPTTYTTPPATKPGGGAIENKIDSTGARTDLRVFPYLADSFHYYDTAATNANWFRLLDYFEVPSPVLGTLGPVGAGQNGDWARRDVRPGMINLNLIIDEEVFLGLIDDVRLNMSLVGATGDVVPQVITSLNSTGGVATYTSMNNRGFNDGTSTSMKAAFSDFLKMRHGGTGFLFDYRYYFGASTFPEKPFRSLSTFNINDTIMRPARMAAMTGGDHGVRTGTPEIQIPPRMLFEIPDDDPNARNMMFVPPSDNPAGELGRVTTPTDHTNLTNSYANLFSPLVGGTPTYPTSSVTPNTNLGGAPQYTIMNPGEMLSDLRKHPYYRTEMLQKVMNLTTTRTHQFAVWVTVGYFEVVQEGNPQLAGIDPTSAYDLLGPERGSADGTAVRQRAFFVIDRTKANGFNPSDSGDFHELITFSRRIE